MDAILTNVPWGNLGAGTVLLFAILAIIRGDLVTRREHETALARLEDTIRRERALTDRAMSALRLVSAEYGTTADRVLSALPTDEGADDGTP